MSIFSKRDSSLNSGLSHCVVYFKDGHEYWHGLVNLEEQYDIVDNETIYVDGSPQNIHTYASTYACSIDSYTFPDRILDETFGMSYRTFTDLDQKQYEIHLVYGCSAVLESVTQQTLINEVATPGFSFTIETLPKRSILYTSPVSRLTIKPGSMWSSAIQHIEDILYGTTTEEPRLPSIEEIIEILELYVYLKITDHGDGTWTAEEMNGASGIVKMTSSTEFTIEWDSAKYIQDQVYTIHSK